MKEKLNLLLSDLVVFYHKLQSYHWYVKGTAFFEVHAKLEEYYDGINEQIDEVAEVMLMEGLKPASTMKDFLKIAKIKEGVKDYVEPSKIFKSVLDDFKYLLKSAEAVKAQADKKNNYFVSAKMDELIGDYKKTIWMISQSMMK